MNHPRVDSELLNFHVYYVSVPLQASTVEIVKIWKLFLFMMRVTSRPNEILQVSLKFDDVGCS